MAKPDIHGLSCIEMRACASLAKLAEGAGGDVASLYKIETSLAKIK